MNINNILFFHIYIKNGVQEKIMQAINKKTKFSVVGLKYQYIIMSITLLSFY